MPNYRVGTACQLLEWKLSKRGDSGSYVKMDDTAMGTVKVCHVENLTKTEQYQKIFAKARANVHALTAQLLHISFWPETARMFRISSELLPLIDHPDYEWVYKRGEVAKWLEMHLKQAGEIALVNDIRISVHPSQWITFFSPNKAVVAKSIHHVKIWMEILSMMGHGPENNVVIVMHTNGQSDKFPEEAAFTKDWIGLENDEKQAGFYKTLKICQDNGIRMILDVHHFRVEQGALIGINSDELNAVLETWKGKGRPKLHISSSRGTENKKELCAHADFISEEDLHNHSELIHQFDFMVEAKLKNIASSKVHRYFWEKFNEKDNTRLSNSKGKA